MRLDKDDRRPGAGTTGSPRLSVHIGRKSFGTGGRKGDILRDLHFEAQAGQFMSLLGPSGCGKTTLLKLIAGLDRDYEGEISVDGAPVKGPGLAVGVVFQESRLLPWRNVERNVDFALPARSARTERSARVQDIIELVGLTSARLAWPYQLSGGMEKRVGLARALVNLPKILLMDEPFSALDTTSKFLLQDKVAEIHSRESLTTILVTHDIDEALYLSDRIAVLSASPSAILTIYEIRQTRPRSRTSEETMIFKRKIIDDLM